MAAAIRESIIDALVTALATVTVTNGYRTEINKVEQRARDWAEMRKVDANPTDGGWLGVVSQEENYTDTPGIVESTWVIDVIAHIRTSATTEAAALTATSDLATDLRRLLYNTQTSTLGVAGVHFVRLVQKLDSIGSPEALQERWATAKYRLNVKFEESLALA